MKSYASFQRQLNFYGFRRIGEGPNKGAYCHKLFQQGNPHLLPLIKRQHTIKSSPNLVRTVSAGSSSSNNNSYSAPSLLMKQEQAVFSGGGGAAATLHSSNPFKHENRMDTSATVKSKSLDLGHLLSFFQPQHCPPTSPTTIATKTDYTSTQQKQPKEATPTKPQPKFDYFEGRIFYFIPDDQSMDA